MDKTNQQIVEDIINLQLGRKAGTEIPVNANLQDDLNADSLDAVEIIMEIEDSFDIEVPDAIAEKIETMEDILDYLDEVLYLKGEANRLHPFIFLIYFQIWNSNCFFIA